MYYCNRGDQNGSRISCDLAVAAAAAAAAVVSVLVLTVGRTLLTLAPPLPLPIDLVDVMMFHQETLCRRLLPILLLLIIVAIGRSGATIKPYDLR